MDTQILLGQEVDHAAGDVIASVYDFDLAQVNQLFHDLALAGDFEGGTPRALANGVVDEIPRFAMNRLGSRADLIDLRPNRTRQLRVLGVDFARG